MFHKYWLEHVVCWWCWIFLYPSWFSVCFINSWGHKVSNYSHTFVYLSFNYISFFFIYFVDLLFSAYTVRIAISSWWTDTIINDVPLCLWSFSWLRFTLSDIKYRHSCFPLIKVYVVYLLSILFLRQSVILYLVEYTYTHTHNTSLSIHQTMDTWDFFLWFSYCR